MKRSVSHNRLARTLARIDGAYAHSTVRAYRADFEDFIAFCASQRKRALPASPAAVVGYILELTERGRRSSTIRRALAGIASIHQFNGYTDPTKGIDARLAIRRMHRQLGRYSRQALAINRDVLDRMLATTDNTLRGHRDRALLLVAYDTLCRRGELLSLQIEDIKCQQVSSRKRVTSILLRRSKTDPEAQGR